MNRVSGVDRARRAVGVGRLWQFGCAQGSGHEVVLAKQAARSARRCLDDVGKGDPPLQVLRQDVPARVGRRLEADAGDPRPLEPELDDRADLVLVDARLQRGRRASLDAAPAQGLDGPELGLDQRLAAEGSTTSLVEPVELEVDFEPVAACARRRRAAPGRGPGGCRWC